MAEARLCVTKITLEYVLDRKAFTIQLDPMETAAIFFDQPAKEGAGGRDMAAAQAKQTELFGAGTPGVRPVTELPVNPRVPLQDQALAGLVGAKTVDVREAPGDPGGPTLWWHSGACRWFHPKG